MMFSDREERDYVESLEEEIELLLNEQDDLEGALDDRDATIQSVRDWLKTHNETLPKLAVKQLKKILS